MYIFGNSSCLLNAENAGKEQKQLWFNIIKTLNDKQNFGNSLTLKCKNHSTSTIVKKPEDFKNVPEGGCKEFCKARLNCGHTCQSYCHLYEITDNDTDGHK